MQSYAVLDDQFLKADKIGLSIDNRSFRYGDGFFETMRMINGQINLKELHFSRMFRSFDLLHFKPPSFFTPTFFEQKITELANRNGVTQSSRIRLTFFRGDGGLYDETSHHPNYIVQAWPLKPVATTLNTNGLDLAIVPHITKNNDALASVKSNSFLSYAMAAFWVKQQKLNDCLLKNPFGKITDATIANVFIIKDEVLTTPPLNDGPVDGVMRKYLVDAFRKSGLECQEASLDASDFKTASEVFLTNAIYGIRWVKQVDGSTYTNQMTSQLYQKFIVPLFGS